MAQALEPPLAWLLPESPDLAVLSQRSAPGPWGMEQEGKVSRAVGVDRVLRGQT